MLNRFLWPILALSASCVEVRELSLEAFSGQTVILALESQDDLQVVVQDTTSRTLSVNIDEMTVRALVYAETIEELGLHSGLVSPPPIDRPWRPFPRGYELHQGSWNGQAFAWTIPSDPALTERMRRFRFPGIDPVHCPSEEGCLLHWEGSVYCEKPCRFPPPPGSPDVPELPTLPDLTPCPTGWTQEDRHGVALCRPHSLDPCVDPEAIRFPEQTDCALLDATCPVSGWADDLPTAPTLYVRAGAAGGDGTIMSPFGTIEEALAVAAVDSVIALSEGTHQGRITLSDAQRLWGACATGTILYAEGGSLISVAAAADVALRHLTLTSSGSDGIEVDTGATVDLENVYITHVDRAIDLESNVTLSARHLVVKDTTGYVLQMSQDVNNIQVALDHVWAEHFSKGIRVSGQGTRATFNELVMQQANSDDFAIKVMAGALLEMNRSVLVDHSDGGLEVEGAEATLADVWSLRSSVEALEGATLTADRIVVEEPLQGVQVKGGVGRFTNLIVENSQSHGINAKEGFELDLDRALLVSNAGFAVSAGAAGSGRFTDVTAREGVQLPDGKAGDGFVLGEGNYVVTRVLVEDHIAFGFVLREQARGEVKDLAVRHTTLRNGIKGGIGIDVRASTELRGERISVTDSHGTGVRVGDAEGGSTSPRFEVTGLSIARSGECGLVALFGSVGINKAKIDHSNFAGVQNSGATMELMNVEVTNTTSVAFSGIRNCKLPDELPDKATGISLIEAKAQTTLSQFVVSHNHAGIRLEESATLSADRGVISNNEVGVSIGMRSGDCNLGEVVFSKNTVNLDAVSE